MPFFCKKTLKNQHFLLLTEIFSLYLTKKFRIFFSINRIKKLKIIKKIKKSIEFLKKYDILQRIIKHRAGDVMVSTGRVDRQLHAEDDSWPR